MLWIRSGDDDNHDDDEIIIIIIKWFSPFEFSCVCMECMYVYIHVFTSVWAHRRIETQGWCWDSPSIDRFSTLLVREKSLNETQSSMISCYPACSWDPTSGFWGWNYRWAPWPSSIYVGSENLNFILTLEQHILSPLSHLPSPMIIIFIYTESMWESHIPYILEVRKVLFLECNAEVQSPLLHWNGHFSRILSKCLNVVLFTWEQNCNRKNF